MPPCSNHQIQPPRIPSHPTSPAATTSATFIHDADTGRPFLILPFSSFHPPLPLFLFAVGIGGAERRASVPCVGLRKTPLPKEESSYPLRCPPPAPSTQHCLVNVSGVFPLTVDGPLRAWTCAIWPCWSCPERDFANVFTGIFESLTGFWELKLRVHSILY